MQTISYDAQSFMLDGRRIWLTSGSIHYPRVPRQLWRARIRAAKQAGLNCISTYVFWNVHEPSPGKFHFAEQADLRHFVELIGSEGMYCILRPGPYVCGEWDFGGLPAWLLRDETMKLREAHGPFLEATARYFGKVLEQVADLQVTSPKPGPIVLMQAENEWFCHNEKQIDGYLGEVVRYLRENGCTVPISMCNNLWARLDGVIDTWNAREHLLDHLRQFRMEQRNAPRLVTEYWPGWFDRYGEKHQPGPDAAQVEHDLAQILAAGAQCNLYMFHGGTNFGDGAARQATGDGGMLTNSYDYDAPLAEAGAPTAKYEAVKRVSTFASQFDHVFAHLSADDQRACLAPDSDEPGVSIVHQHGTQGDVVFFLRSAKDKTKQIDLLLPNGLTLPVSLGDDRAAWVLLDANLGGVAELTYTNLRPWALIDKRLLVLFGPAGSDGVICIDGAPLSVKVPTGKTPLVDIHEELTLVVLNHEQVNAAVAMDKWLIVGCDGVNEQDEPRPRRGWAQAYVIDGDGDTQTVKVAPSRKSAAPKLNDWQYADAAALVDGTSEAYAAIDGPAGLETLKQTKGYGWYRLKMKAAATGNIIADGGDRLHLFAGGKATDVLGIGPGAQRGPAKLNLTKDVTVLADNAGHACYGWTFGERKGLYGHIYQVEPQAMGKAKIVTGRAPDAFALRGYWTQLHAGERPPADTVTWTYTSRSNQTLIFDIDHFAAPAMLIVNDQPIGVYHPQLTGSARFVLHPQAPLKRGKNIIEFALFEPYDAKAHSLKAVSMYRVKKSLTERAAWAFAPFALPKARQFVPAPASTPALPGFYRATFSVTHTDVPLWLEPDGMTKGQLYLNGHNLGRYFQQTATGKHVGPQKRYYLPEPWLHIDKPNELTLFDEHGRSPDKCKLVYDHHGPNGKR
jgi:hypothetical protein